MNTSPNLYLAILIVILLFFSYNLTSHLIKVIRQQKYINIFKDNYSKKFWERFSKDELLDLMILFVYKGVYDIALSIFNKIIVNADVYSNLQLAECYNAVGNIYLKLHYTSLAIKNYQTALSFGSQNITLYFNLAKALEKAKTYDLAIKTYKTILDLEPGNKQAYKKLQQVACGSSEYK